MNCYTLKYNLYKYPEETYYITKYITKQEEEVNPKIVGAMVELLVDGYLEHASEENINECFEILTQIQKSQIDWENSTEINDLLEKYF